MILIDTFGHSVFGIENPRIDVKIRSIQKMKVNDYSIENSVLQLSEAANKKLSSALQKISTGLQINSAGDDAAGLALSEKLNASTREANQSVSNSRMEQAMLKVADSDLSTISDNNQRIRDLAVKASNEVYGDDERQMIQQEVTQLQQENDRIAQSSRFSDKQLLDGSAEGTQIMTEQKAPTEIKEAFKSASMESLGVDNVDVTSPAKARELIDKIDNAQTTINQRRTELGSASKALDSNIERTQVKAENLMSANSTIRDTDIAKQISETVNAKIMMSAAVAMQSQANSTSKTVMGLLRT